MYKIYFAQCTAPVNVSSKTFSQWTYYVCSCVRLQFYAERTRRVSTAPSYSTMQIIYVYEICVIHTTCACVLMDLAAIISRNIIEFPPDSWLTQILGIEASGTVLRQQFPNFPVQWPCLTQTTSKVFPLPLKLWTILPAKNITHYIMYPLRWTAFIQGTLRTVHTKFYPLNLFCVHYRLPWLHCSDATAQSNSRIFWKQIYIYLQLHTLYMHFLKDTNM